MIYKKALLFSIALFLFATLAQIMSWQYSLELKFVSLAGISISYSGVFIQKESKDFFDFIKVAMVIVWAIINVLLALNYIDFVFFRKVERGLFSAFIFLGFMINRNEIPLISLSLSKENALSIILLIVSIVIIGIGSILKNLSFPNANLLLMIGYGLAIFLMILNIFNQKK